ncbi:MAG: DUF4189 domain-containing protein [Hoeflea sp.]|uniref:DUF4189 domain-containing protein n=1 Tax=Hoeflea sp. TaxID=1940281 RepID=UPI001D494395|nr:DUF4189 domain-containing protein [Hoeflea sp.]MBU4531071.1 DUF4189 domain-containing protein [Alphaproteobacteria bacterium]MBU4542846.1 DUF4189 domain-containing protein [Alphaproteobacteria bacterium]MBU4552658.1 DUF4189 domain-containing protein [Alphaproteobacteria bacterium]MBV1722963.1 DUF4189 domain-containing protein [Hoeflea sp.]MBV1762874.1 DUF4189 domain-containing protein [Hoeflea sp.]
MKKYEKNMLAVLFAAAIAAASASPAMAWGCIALAEEDDSYGYSYNFEYQEDAAERALNECAERTSSDDVCVIVECDEDS